jgi:GNAT superfamily N-acetyltransferase
VTSRRPYRDGYRIRAARRKDVDYLPQIERDAARRFAPFGIEEAMAGPGVPLELLVQRQRCGQLWVALDRADHPVGFAVASVVDDHGHLDELDVLVRHGGRGLGTRLVKVVCRWAYRARLSGVTLSTLRTIPWNEPFYSRLGFEVVPENELSDNMIRLRQLEALAGLPVAERVIMCRRF